MGRDFTMGTPPTCLNDVITQMLALQKSLPPRPSFPELEIAIATIVKVDDELAARQDELLRQSKPEDVKGVIFVAFQEMRMEFIQNRAKEQKREPEEVIGLEERHRKYDKWIRKVHGYLSSVMSATSGKDEEDPGETYYPVPKVLGSEKDQARIMQGSARSVHDAVWNSPNLESPGASSVVVSSLVGGDKPNPAKSLTHGHSNSFSRVARSLSWNKEQRKPDIFSGDVDAEGKEANSSVLKDVKSTVSVLSVLDSALKQKQTCLDLHGAFLKEIEWVPESIGQMIWLTDLNLSGNRLTILPDSIGNLANLSSLDISTNQLIALPDTIGQLRCLRALILDNNKVEELPYTIGQCTSLVELRASFNQLKALPEATGKLTQLRSLDVHWNKLGSLPTTIASLKSLVDLDASFNEIHHVPEGLCQVITLTRLNLASNFNELQELPQDIGNLQKLKVLNLSCNQLKVLPDSFAMLTNLQELDLRENNWRVPPKEITDQGREAILKYMADHVATKENGNAVVHKRPIWTKVLFSCCKPSVIETDIVA